MWYYLDLDGNVQRTDDYASWMAWYERSADRRMMARHHIGRFTITTVFLGVDHGRGEQPVLWETLVSEDVSRWRRWLRRLVRARPLAGVRVWRSATNAEACATHNAMVQLARRDRWRL